MAQTFAYLRVSKLDQDLDKNKMDILRLAHEKRLGHVEFVEEKVSGKVSWRKRQIAGVLEQAQEGDAIIVNELSRLGRSMLECMEILSLPMQKNVRIFAGKRNWQLDNSIQSKIVAMAAEIERDLIRNAPLRHCRRANNGGMPLGRPKGVGKSKLDEHKEKILALLNNGSIKAWIARRYGTTPSNLRH